MKYISLFCGAGGLDIGFEEEGFIPIIAYDIKQCAVNTYNFNRKKKIAFQCDLSQKSGDQIISALQELKISDIPNGVIGGPPCQYFSNGNKSVRDKDDLRRTLPIIYANLLKALNKTYSLDFFIFENVSGLTNPQHHDDFIRIQELFEDAGFNVYHTILDAYNFGLAQHRKRVFLIGWNKIKYSDYEFHFPLGIPSGKVIADVIHGLPEPMFFQKKGAFPSRFPIHPNHWTMNPKSDKFKNPPPPELKKYPRSFRRLTWDNPSDTVAYGHNEIHIHPSDNRRLSIFEAMLLQGFPKNYRLLGNFTEQVSLVSDAVPPPLASALAKSIRYFMAGDGNK